MRRTTLDLLPGLRWKGKLHVNQRLESGDYVVDFDAVASKAHPNERHVMDTATLTPQQLEDWTGWKEDV